MQQGLELQRRARARDNIRAEFRREEQLREQGFLRWTFFEIPRAFLNRGQSPPRDQEHRARRIEGGDPYPLPRQLPDVPPHLQPELLPRTLEDYRVAYDYHEAERRNWWTAENQARAELDEAYRERRRRDGGENVRALLNYAADRASNPQDGDSNDVIPRVQLLDAHIRLREVESESDHDSDDE